MTNENKAGRILVRRSCRYGCHAQYDALHDANVILYIYIYNINIQYTCYVQYNAVHDVNVMDRDVIHLEQGRDDRPRRPAAGSSPSPPLYVYKTQYKDI